MSKKIGLLKDIYTLPSQTIELFKPTSPKSVEGLKEGHWVKIRATSDSGNPLSELFWVRIMFISDGEVHGSVDNDLVLVKSLKCDDRVKFPVEYVIDTLKEN
jgi:hypothetical protein